MTYISFSISTRNNVGHAALRSGAVCGQCKQPIARGHHYTVHAVRTAAMPASGFHYYHAEHAPKQGSGWGHLRAGEAISDLSELKEGDLLLEHSVQFNAFNLLRVVKTRWDGERHDLSGRKFYGMFGDPSDSEGPDAVTTSRSASGTTNLVAAVHSIVPSASSGMLLTATR